MWHRLGARESDEGFTLIELLIVIIILSILAGIVVFAVGTTGSNSADAACSADAKAFQSALEEYKAQVGYYPGAVALQTTVGNPSPLPLPNFGESWGIGANANKTATGVGGLTGYQGGTWTAPDGVVVGPIMRTLPSTQHYQIITDGNGEVFVYPPPPAKVNITEGVLDNQANPVTVQTPEFGATLPNGSPDTSLLNFEADPGICSDPNVVS